MADAVNFQRCSIFSKFHLFCFLFFASEASFCIYTLLKIPRFLRNSLNVLASFLDSIRDFKFKSLYLGWPKAGPVYKYLRLPIRGVFLAIRGGVCRATI